MKKTVAAISRIERLPLPLQAVLLLWELPQTFLGLMLYLLLRACGSILAESTYGGRRLVRTSRLGVSLGFFIFWFGKDDDLSIRQHELGHAFQSLLLGPLYLLLVGLPSFLRACYSLMYAARHRKPWPRYFAAYPERWADRLGGVIRPTNDPTVSSSASSPRPPLES